MTAPARYRWFSLGDFNGFFGLMFDNITVLSFMAEILIIGFQFPKEIVFTRMIPGTALGVCIGDLIYTWMAFRLAKRTNKPFVTAMPLGLDTPSTIGMAVVVLGPAFLALKSQGLLESEAAMMTWYLGMALMVIMGLIKFVLSFCGTWIQKMAPQAGLLGPLAGIGLALIGYIPIVDIFSMPILGVLSLGIVLITLVAKVKLPKNIPGVFFAIFLGSVLYHLLGPLGFLEGTYTKPTLTFHMGFPWPTLKFWAGLNLAIQYLPVAIPFAILTVVGGIDVTESAKLAGDHFSTKDILLTEALATLVAGLCGGVAQSTPYIGHPAYKNMGSRSGYTLLTGLFIGLGGIFGYLSAIVDFIPRPVLAPILVFVALDIMAQAFEACPKRHSPAVAFSFFPTVARLLSIKLTNPDFIPLETLQRLLKKPGKSLPELAVTNALGNGFILTAMLWGSFLAELIDCHMIRSALFLSVLSLFSFFGIVHSTSLDGKMYFPWKLKERIMRTIPYRFSLGYLLLSCVVFLLSWSSSSKSPSDPPCS